MQSQNDKSSRSVHGWSFAVTVLMFPLIWLGGLVTTHDAGMAVPDWPGTYGYNLFLYPWTTWLFGPFDLFVEHGHRLLASLVGLLAIVLCVMAARNESRIWLRRACYLLLLAIVSQGVLGGLRVLFDARTVAMIHGCLGPLVFAFGGFIVMASSRDRWATNTMIRASGLRRCAFVLLVLSVLQLLVGANLRHAQPFWLPGSFAGLVHTHLLFATLITVFVVVVNAWVSRNPYREIATLIIPARLLLVILMFQVVLGIATWVANYAAPWAELTAWLARYTVQGKGFWESMIVTGHQATGSLLILTSLWLYYRVYLRTNPEPFHAPSMSMARSDDTARNELVSLGTEK